MAKDNKEMAFITDAAYGFVDNQGVGLQLQLRLIQGGTVLFIKAEEANKFIEELKIGNVLGLKGKPVAVSVGEDRIVRFEHLL
jgi:hypothetical protein